MSVCRFSYRLDIFIGCMFRHCKLYFCQSNLKGATSGPPRRYISPSLSPPLLFNHRQLIQWLFFLLMFCHYISSYCDQYHSTSDCCMLQSITHHYNSYTSSHLCRPDNTGSAQHSSAATVDSKGHNERFCWLHHCFTAKATSVWMPSLVYAYFAMGPL